MRVYLIRHGESEGNAAGVLQGRTEYPLTEEGRRQAAVVGEFLRWDLGNEPVTHFFSSPLARAAETAAIIRRALPGSLPDTLQHDSLREVHCGVLEGMKLTAIKETYPDFQWPRSNWLDLQDYGGQSRAEFFGLVHEWFDSIALPWESAEPGAIIIVTHAATLRALLGYFLGQRDFHHLHYHFGNASLLRLGLRRSDQGTRPALEAMLTNQYMAAIVAGVATEARAGGS